MPFRSPKMYGFIFGFQRLVWWPKWTPASSRSFVAIPDKIPPPRLTLAELEALARASQAVLLPFLHARIRRQEPVFLEQPCGSSALNATSARAMPRRTAPACPLTPPPATVASTSNCSPVSVTVNGRLHLHAQRLGREEVLELAVVDRDGARFRDGGRRGRPTSCAGLLRSIRCWPSYYDLDGFRVAAPRADDPPSRRP